MYTIVIQKPSNTVVSIVAEHKDIHDVLAILENSSSVYSYKISIDGSTMNDNELRYHFGGYVKPAGKAVDKFNWDV